jgi:hypothetical protein
MPACDYGTSREECGCKDCREMLEIMKTVDESPKLTKDQLRIKELELEILKLKNTVKELREISIHKCGDKLCDMLGKIPTNSKFYCRDKDNCLHGRCPLSKGEFCGNCD